MTTIPYHLSERHFRRYEPYLRDIVAAWPTVVTFVPKPPVASEQTLSSRIRMAIKSLAIYKWQPTIVNMQIFEKCHDKIYVSTTVRPGYVVCGPMSAVVPKRGVQPVEIDVTDSQIQQVIPRVRLTNPPLDLITALFVLHHHQLLSEPSVIETAEDIGHLIGNHDVSVQRDGNKYTIL